jgi:hypothetical protein
VLIIFQKIKAKNFYREDAKFAKKQNTSPDFLSSFALLAVRMVLQSKELLPQRR